MRIGDLLLSSGFVSEQDLKAALIEQSDNKAPIGQVLKVLNRLSDSDLELVLQAQRKILFAQMPSELAVSGLRYAREKELSFMQAIRELSNNSPITEKTAASGHGLKQEGGKFANSLQNLIDQSDQAAAKQDWERSVALLEQARELCNQIQAKSPEQTIPVLCRLAAVYSKTKRNQEAKNTINNVLDKVRGGTKLAPGLLTLLAAAANLCSRNGMTLEADRLYKLVLPKWSNFLPFEISHFSFCLRDAIATSRLLNTPKRHNFKIGELLCASGLISQEQFDQALSHSKDIRKPLGRALSESGLVANKDLRNAMRVQLLCRSAIVPNEYAAFTLKAASFARPDANEFFQKLNLAPESIVSSPAHLVELVSKMDKLLLLEESLGIEDPEVAILADELADISLKRNEEGEAETLFRRAHSVLAKSGAKYEHKLANTCQKLARLLVNQKKYPEAELLFLQSMEIKSRILGEQTQEYAEILYDVGYLYFCQASYEPAIGYLRSAWMIQCQDASLDDKRNLLELLIKCFEQSDQDSEAEIYRQQLRSLRLGE